MDTTASFGYWVRRRRKALDLTQASLAKAAGCAVVTLRKIEADERRPSAVLAERLASSLQLPVVERPAFLATALGQRAAARLPLASAPAGRPRTNLPAPVNKLIGREADTAAIAGCLRRGDVRLLTLTGPVGVGKTRLAMEVGRGLQADFRDGVYLIALSEVHDPALVPAATATALGVREKRACALLQTLLDHLATTEMLLIFDNYEHLLPAATFLATLLAACPGLHLLVTSRVRLHLYGEHEFVVPPLEAADDGDAATLANASAVRLFCDRARAARPDFCLTPALTSLVGEICRRLDCLPLAIELAAARLKILSPHELQQRLEQRLPWLTQAAADLPSRLLGLENAIIWSYDLLTPLQRSLLARLSVCAGGFTLSAAEAICGFPGLGPYSPIGQDISLPEMDATVEALLDQSLLQRGEAPTERHFTVSGCCPACPRRELHLAAQAEIRFAMLGTIREFALARLQASGELETLQRRHADYFAAWAASAAAQLSGPDQARWLERLEIETGNLRAALAWLLAAGETTRAADLACILEEFWQRHGHYSEGRLWLDQILAQIVGSPVSDLVRGRALRAAAALAYRQGDHAQACPWLVESLALLRAANDRSAEARALFDLGWIAIDQGNWADAVRFNAESLVLARAVDEPCAIYRALTNLGWAKLSRGEANAAATLFGEAYALAAQIGHTKGVAVSLANLAWIALQRGELTPCVTQAQAGLRLCHLLGEREVLAECLEILAAAAAAAGDVQRGLLLGGGAEVLWEALHVVHPPTRALVVGAAAQNDPGAHLAGPDNEAVWRQGRQMRLETVVALALGCRHAIGEIGARG